TRPWYRAETPTLPPAGVVSTRTGPCFSRNARSSANVGAGAAFGAEPAPPASASGARAARVASCARARGFCMAPILSRPSWDMFTGRMKLYRTSEAVVLEEAAGCFALPLEWDELFRAPDPFRVVEAARFGAPSTSLPEDGDLLPP